MMKRFSLLLFLCLPLLAFGQEARWATDVLPALEPAPASPSLFWQYIFPVLLTGVSALVAWGLKILGSFVNSKVESISVESSAKRWAVAGEKLLVIVSGVVADANVRLKAKLASYLEDGKISPEEAAAIKAEVMLLVKEKLTPELLGYLKGQFGDLFEHVLSGTIERAVVNLKPTEPKVGPPSP